MHHDTPLITMIVAGLVLAYIFGMVANRLRLPPLVGYLLAGVLVGPHTPGFVADQALGAELAELGVILLMFGVGLHFSLKDLLSVRALAIPGALVQIAVATLLGAGLGTLLGWGLGASVLFGLALSVASTVVLLKALQDRRLIETERGRIAVGWLIVEDLAMVLALVLVPAFASSAGSVAGIHDPFVSFVERVLRTDVGLWGALALTLLKLAAFAGFMMIVGRRAIPWALHITAHTGSRELFRLAVLAIALGVALGSAVLFGVSLALGAFFAGMILSESELSHRAAQETLPLRDAFAVLFFVSVGMLFDPAILVTDPLPVLATVFIIVVGKSLAAFGIVLLFRRPAGTALTISASLAQIGEFSFILASMGVALAIFPPAAQDLIVAGALISIVLNPAVFWAAELLRPHVEARVAQSRAAQIERDGVIEPPMTAADAPAPSGPLTSDAPTNPDSVLGEDEVAEPTEQKDHTVLVGYGRVGSVVGQGLHSANSPVVVIEDSDHSIAAAREAGLEVVVGNAASAEVLNLANVAGARTLLIAIPDGFEAGSVCEQGRKLGPAVRIIARAHSTDEETHLRSLGADVVIMGEREIGLGMLAWLRGERNGNGPEESAPAEPKLPVSDNLLARAAVAVPADGEPVSAAMLAKPQTPEDNLGLAQSDGTEPPLAPVAQEPTAADGAAAPAMDTIAMESLAEPTDAEAPVALHDADEPRAELEDAEQPETPAVVVLEPDEPWMEAPETDQDAEGEVSGTIEVVEAPVLEADQGESTPPEEGGPTEVETTTPPAELVEVTQPGDEGPAAEEGTETAAPIPLEDEQPIAAAEAAEPQSPLEEPGVDGPEQDAGEQSAEEPGEEAKGESAAPPVLPERKD